MQVERRALLGMIAAGLVAPPLLARGPASYPAPDRELMVPVQGGRIYVRVNGDLNGPRPPVVMLHGGPGGTHNGMLGLLALADERAVILYDQLDSGRSDQPNDPANWRVDRFVDELDAIRTALTIRRWHVAGFSWGGTVVLEYGARRPAALQGLILGSPLISTKSWIADANILRRQLPMPVQAQLNRCETRRPPPKAVCDTATDAFYAAFNRRLPPTDGAIAYTKAGGRGSNERLYNAMWGSSEFVSTGTLKNYDGEPLLARLDGDRTLFICGQYDEARPETIGRFAARVPGAEFAVVPGASHGLENDRPFETIALLRGWMRRHDAA